MNDSERSIVLSCISTAICSHPQDCSSVSLPWCPPSTFERDPLLFLPFDVEVLFFCLSVRWNLEWSLLWSFSYNSIRGGWIPHPYRTLQSLSMVRVPHWMPRRVGGSLHPPLNCSRLPRSHLFPPFTSLPLLPGLASADSPPLYLPLCSLLCPLSPHSPVSLPDSWRRPCCISHTESNAITVSARGASFPHPGWGPGT